MRNHRRHQFGNLSRRLLLAKVKVTVIPEHFAQYHDGVHVRLFHLLALVAGQKLHLLRQFEHFGFVVGHGCNDNVAVPLDEVVGVEAARAEVDEHQTATGGIVQKVGPIRIGLHAFQFEKFAQAEFENGGADVFAMVVAGGMRGEIVKEWRKS